MKPKILHPLTAVTCAAIATLALSGHCQTNRVDVIPLMKFESVPLIASVETLVRHADINFVVDPHWLDGLRATNSNWSGGPFVTVIWTNITAPDALARLLKEHGLFAVANPQTGVTRITSTNLPPQVFDKEFIGANTNGIIPLIQLMDVPLAGGLKQIADTNQLKIEIDPAVGPLEQAPFFVTPTISVRWEKLTARQAIAAVCENYNLKISKAKQPDTWRISVQ